jgi:hypothetical protein
MSSNNRVSATVQEIRQRLAEAQGAPAQAPPPTAEADGDKLRVTKDGRLVQPGESVPLDAGAISTIPDATFHAAPEVAAAPTRRALYVAKDAAMLMRSAAASSSAEHGGALIGSPVSGDVTAFVPTPDQTSRSRTHISFCGEDMQADIERALAAHSGSTFVGYVHSHDGLDTLSSGDHATFHDSRAPWLRSEAF